MRKPVVFMVLAAGVAVAGIGLWRVLAPVPAPTEAVAGVIIPDMTGEIAQGARSYDAKCASCHGVNAVGVEGAGPPFLHKIYEPSHHGDAAFYLAAKNGVRAHHWPFGDMPPVEGITEAEVSAIVAYVRNLQAANGVF